MLLCKEPSKRGDTLDIRKYWPADTSDCIYLRMALPYVRELEGHPNDGYIPDVESLNVTPDALEESQSLVPAETDGVQGGDREAAATLPASSAMARGGSSMEAWNVTMGLIPHGTVPKRGYGRKVGVTEETRVGANDESSESAPPPFLYINPKAPAHVIKALTDAHIAKLHPTMRTPSFDSVGKQGTVSYGWPSAGAVTLRDDPSPGPPLEFFTGPQMLDVVMKEFKQIKSSFAGMQYCCDHTDCCFQLVLRLKEDVEGRLILDKSQFKNSSCKRQCARMQELYDNGCQMRLLSGPGGGFANMHVKSWILDEGTMLTGSVNLTHGGFENNKEQLFKILDPAIVAQCLEDFEKSWAIAEPVSERHILLMQTNKAKRDEKPPDVSHRRTRSVTRSLSAELETVDQDGKGRSSSVGI